MVKEIDETLQRPAWMVPGTHHLGEYRPTTLLSINARPRGFAASTHRPAVGYQLIDSSSR
jgi:hypothetical protein